MTMEGPLSKWTNVMQGWQYRWFVIDINSSLLSYYTSKDKMKRGSRRGCIRLKNAILGIDDEDESTFTVTSTKEHRTYHFQARDGDERQKWIDALEEAINSAGSGEKNLGDKGRKTLASFDRKLAETDAYLQMLINQVKAMGDKIELCESETDKEKYNVIKLTAESMIEAIKKAIVMMQLAKPRPASDDEGEDYRGVELTEDAVCTSKAIRSNSLPSSHFSTPPSTSQFNGRNGASAQATPDFTPPGSPRVDRELDRSDKNSHNTDSHKSDSGSENDDFFDASDNYHPSPSSRAQQTLVEEDNEENAESPPVITSINDVFDDLYDSGGEEELGSLSEHGSIITHLLSQIRIGMDLTKIVLPTFILERRSLLEMFADFFSHPDLFVRIGDYKTPEERITEVVRWYLSAFHAGRKSSVAKKPYNPILGETFQCMWDVPGNSSSENSSSDDGPGANWSTPDDLCCLAEQVSHHPPISAFYAECPNKRISVDGYIWTKSKFLGLSIGVHMVGQAVISLLDHDEEYVITFPSGYGRSILTVPWIELGGKCTVACEKTGYNAVVDFLTKPFYGGKKDQIKAQINSPSGGKPTCTINGAWNGTMWAEYATGRSEIFCDTIKMPIVKKQVKPISQQEPMESRRLWKDVTLNLKNKDVHEATRFKQLLEQKQREEAKERAATGAKIQNKFFQEVGEHWVYTNPLVRRQRPVSS